MKLFNNQKEALDYLTIARRFAFAEHGSTLEEYENRKNFMLRENCVLAYRALGITDNRFFQVAQELSSTEFLKFSVSDVIIDF